MTPETAASELAKLGVQGVIARRFEQGNAWAMAIEREKDGDIFRHALSVSRQTGADAKAYAFLFKEWCQEIGVTP